MKEDNKAKARKGPWKPIELKPQVIPIESFSYIGHRTPTFDSLDDDKPAFKVTTHVGAPAPLTARPHPQG